MYHMHRMYAPSRLLAASPRASGSPSLERPLRLAPPRPSGSKLNLYLHAARRAALESRRAPNTSGSQDLVPPIPYYNVHVLHVLPHRGAARRRGATCLQVCFAVTVA